MIRRPTVYHQNQVKGTTRSVLVLDRGDLFFSYKVADLIIQWRWFLPYFPPLSQQKVLSDIQWVWVEWFQTKFSTIKRFSWFDYLSSLKHKASDQNTSEKNVLLILLLDSVSRVIWLWLVFLFSTWIMVKFWFKRCFLTLVTYRAKITMLNSMWLEIL